jgi:putative NADPH-quinone reductase
MTRHILVINGHPDPSPERFAAALCDAYASGARDAGFVVHRLEIGRFDLPPIRNAEDFIGGPVPEAARFAQGEISWADHIVIVHPLWLGGQPAMLKAFFEQVFRYGFAISQPGAKSLRRLLKGRSARLVVTMGMPAPVFRFVFGAFGVRGLERGLLRLSGISPIRRTLIGLVEGDAAVRRRWLKTVQELGRRGI